MNSRPLAVILGPTGSGKSALALHIAREFRGEIVNCDSLQVYRGFDIGTAKPSLAERGEVPHHLFDILEPDEIFTAGDYARRARVLLAEIAARGRLPVIAGGAGFYLRALFDGLSPAPLRDPALRECLLARERRRPGVLHRLLGRLDPDAGSRIHGHDMNKTLRALEIRLRPQKAASTLSAQSGDPLTGFHAVRIGLNPPRPALYRAIEERVVWMFQNGLIAETEALLARGVSNQVKPFESLGYKEVMQYLKGTMACAEAVSAAQQATRRYAKRQMTWFRKEPGVHWFQGFGSDQAVREEVGSLMKLESL